MAIIYSYPVVDPTLNDLVLGTDVDAQGKPTKNFTIQSIVSLIQGSATGLEAVLADSPDGGGLNILNIGNITGSGVSTSSSFADGTMTISSGIGTGFVRIESTDFVGDLTGVVKAGSSIQGTVTGVTQAVGTSNTTLATTKFVMDKVDPSVLTFLGTTGGNQTVNLAAQTLSLLGTTSEIKTVSSAQTLTISLADGAFGSGAELILPDGASATTQAATDNTTKVATTAFVNTEDDAQDLDFTGDSGTSSVLLNSQTLDFEGTADEVVTAVTAQKVKFSLPTDVTIGGVFTGTTFAGDLLGTINTATTGVTQAENNSSTLIATTAFVERAATAKTLSYQADAAGTGTMPFTMNLSTDDLDIAGGTNINTSTLAVTTGADPKAVITVNLDDAVTISGTSKADTFTTTAGTATWVTTVLDGFTAITSDLFTGPLAGNASSATALASGGALYFGGEVTLSSSTPSPATYTSGGNITLNLGLNNAAVTGKILTGLVIPASGSSVVPSDTILSGIGKLQAQVNTGATGLRFMGSWNASMDTGGTDNTPNGTPALTSGGGLATSGTNTSVNTPVDNKLIDSSASFTSTVTANDRVYNEAGAFTTITSIDSDTELTLVDAIFLTTGQAYTIDNDPALSQGEYYVVSAVGASESRNATLNGTQDWAVGDWVIAGAGNTWEKLDQTGVDGTGNTGRLAKFSSTSVIADSIILEETGGIKLDSGKTITTQGAGGSLVVGGAATISGLTTAGAALSLTGGVNLPTGAYGTANQVLGNANAAGAAGNDLVWITPTTGTVESVTDGVGIILTGDAVDPVVNVDYVGTNNVILSAGAAVTPVGADTIIINDATTGNVVKALISGLPFDAYNKWVLTGDTGTQDILSGNTVDIAGGTYITTAAAATDTLTITHDDTTRSDTASTDAPAFGGTFDAVTSVTSNGTGHVTAIDISTVTIPSNPVFVGPADATTDGVIGIVPAPGQATFNGGYFLRQDATWVIPPNDKGIETVNTTSPIGGGGSSATVTITHDNSGVTAGTYDSVTVDARGHVTAGTNPFRPERYVSKALTLANSWQPMFAVSKTYGGIISSVFATKFVQTLSGTQALSAHVATQGVSGTWSGSADSQTATTIVYNKIIDTGNGELEIRFVSYNPSSNKTGYKCEARVLTTQGTVDITVQYSTGDSTNPTTFVDLT
jgi:hypothetical protein